MTDLNFAVIGHDCRHIVEYPIEYSGESKSNVGMFTMGASIVFECIHHLQSQKPPGAGESEKGQRGHVVPAKYKRTQYPRIRLAQVPGDGKAPDAQKSRLVIQDHSALIPSNDACKSLGDQSAFTQLALADRIRASVLVVYWNFNHFGDASLHGGGENETEVNANWAKAEECLSGCKYSDITILQLSATAQIALEDVERSIELFTKHVLRTGSDRKVIVVSNSSSLDFIGVTLHRTSSWEQFADDLKFELLGGKYPKLLEFLSKCNSVVVRGSDSATAVVSMRNEAAETSDTTAMDCELFYPVTPKIVPMAHEGYLVGGTSLLTSAIAASFVMNRGNPLRVYDDCLSNGVTMGVRRNILFEQRGYFKSNDSHAPGSPEVDDKWHVSLVERAKTETRETVARAKVGDSPTWSLTQAQIASDSNRIRPTKGPDCKSASQATASRSGKLAAQAAAFLVRNGVQRAAHKFHFPVAQLGDAFVVDRFEYEQYMEMQAEMRSYLQRKDDVERPLSLAVFGRPGAGKSFGIKQLLKTIGVKGLREKPIEANVSQFESLDDLAVTLQKARDVALDGETPLVLWDEFDCEHEGKPFGWFRYFLAPMQDGVFTQRQAPYKIGRAIFVFIGGVNHDYDMFNGRMRDHEFIQAKGPDFASRIRAHLDIKDISRSSDDDQVYILRRAVFLRGFLMKYHKAIVRRHACDGKDGGSDSSCVDIAPEVLRAFLMVDRYEHGVRSLEALVQMCMVSPGQSRLSWSALPSPEQMEGHVSAREFQAIDDNEMALSVFV